MMKRFLPLLVLSLLFLPKGAFAARLFTSGVELQTFTAGVEFDSNSGTPTVDTATFRSGAASMRVNGTSISKFITNQYAGASLAQNRYLRFYLRIHQSSGTASAAIALFRDGTNGNGPSLRLNTDNTLQLWDEQASAQRGSNSSALSLDTWYRIELEYDRAAGSSKAFIDGVQFATGAQTANLDMNVIRLGMIDTATIDFNFDDVAVNDSSGTSQTGLPGAGNVIRLSPTAAGDANSFATQTGGTAGSGNNFTRTNETTPDDATTFNGSATLNEEDLFNVTDSGIQSYDTVNVVQVNGRFRNSTADATGAFKFEIEKAAAGTISQSTAIVPNSTTFRTNVAGATLPKTSPLTLYTDPDGSVWTKTTLDSMQIGYKDTTGPGTAGRRNDVTTVWAYVDYTPGTPPSVTSTSSFFTFFVPFIVRRPLIIY